MDVGEWLRDLGLEQYAQAFRENQVDAQILPKLTAEDLKDLGVTAVGHQRRLLEAIAALGDEAPLAEDIIARERAAEPSETVAPEAERRQLTVLLCDLVGSTELSAPRCRGCAR